MMRSTGFVLFAVGALGFPAPVLAAPNPSALAQLRATINAIESTKADLAAADQEKQQLDGQGQATASRWQDVQRRIAVHNANRCMDTSCTASYNAEKYQLDAEATEIQNEAVQLEQQFTSNQQRTQQLKSQLGFEETHLGLLRIGSANDFARWVQRVKACANISDAQSAEACLNGAWEEHP